ncbi:ZN287-like protein [Mya arenaria]|uniref:ZN287-like protein n=1 Tax=Mya arenaria TaxID=6604 RepID=A0ABY7G7A9_MYAAR|nr:ZN287-like protein [Mya arenaria]
MEFVDSRPYLLQSLLLNGALGAEELAANQATFKMAAKRPLTNDPIYPPKKRALYEHKLLHGIENFALNTVTNNTGLVKTASNHDNRETRYLGNKDNVECRGGMWGFNFVDGFPRPRSDSLQSVQSLGSERGETVSMTTIPRDTSPVDTPGPFDHHTPERLPMSSYSSYNPLISKPLFPQSDSDHSTPGENSPDNSPIMMDNTHRQKTEGNRTESNENPLSDRIPHEITGPAAVIGSGDMAMMSQAYTGQGRADTTEQPELNKMGINRRQGDTVEQPGETSMGPLVSLIDRFNAVAPPKSKVRQESDSFVSDGKKISNTLNNIPGQSDINVNTSLKLQNHIAGKENIENPTNVISASSKNIPTKPLNENFYKCSECVKTFSSVSQLNRHLLMHEDRALSCWICGQEFTGSDKLVCHMRTIHKGANPYKCPHCSREFGQYNNLRRHLRVHRDKQFKCQLCEREFNEEFYLKMHMATHTGQRVYSCGVCGTGFPSSHELKIHVKTHSPSQLHTCDVCGKSFSKACVLRQHKKGHSGDRPHKCDSNGCLLQQHKKGLSDDRPHNCPKTFIHRHHLTMHQRSHTVCKQYACTVCGREFAQSSHLYKHLRCHEQEKENVAPAVNSQVQSQGRRSYSGQVTGPRDRETDNGRVRGAERGATRSDTGEGHVGAFRANLMGDQLGQLGGESASKTETDNTNSLQSRQMEFLKHTGGWISGFMYTSAYATKPVLHGGLGSNPAMLNFENMYQAYSSQVQAYYSQLFMMNYMSQGGQSAGYTYSTHLGQPGYEKPLPSSQCRAEKPLSAPLEGEPVKRSRVRNVSQSIHSTAVAVNDVVERNEKTGNVQKTWSCGTNNSQSADKPVAVVGEPKKVLSESEVKLIRNSSSRSNSSKLSPTYPWSNSSKCVSPKSPWSHSKNLSSSVPPRTEENTRNEIAHELLKMSTGMSHVSSEQSAVSTCISNQSKKNAKNDENQRLTDIFNSKSKDMVSGRFTASKHLLKLYKSLPEPGKGLERLQENIKVESDDKAALELNNMIVNDMESEGDDEVNNKSGNTSNGTGNCVDKDVPEYVGSDGRVACGQERGETENVVNMEDNEKVKRVGIDLGMPANDSDIDTNGEINETGNYFVEKMGDLEKLSEQEDWKEVSDSRVYYYDESLEDKVLEIDVELNSSDNSGDASYTNDCSSYDTGRGEQNEIKKEECNSKSHESYLETEAQTSEMVRSQKQKHEDKCQSGGIESRSSGKNHGEMRDEEKTQKMNVSKAVGEVLNENCVNVAKSVHSKHVWSNMAKNEYGLSNENMDNVVLDLSFSGMAREMSGINCDREMGKNQSNLNVANVSNRIVKSLVRRNSEPTENKENVLNDCTIKLDKRQSPRKSVLGKNNSLYLSGNIQGNMTVGKSPRAVLASRTVGSKENSPKENSRQNPYTCDVCDRSFAQRHHLKRHKMSHNEKTYSCSICNRTFKEEFYLQMHARVHTRQVGGVCDICEETVAEDDAWDHLQRHYGNMADNPTFVEIGARVQQIRTARENC